MRIVLLCGGAGTRFDSVYPKPMNLVHGTPLIHYVLRELPTDVTIAYYVGLDDYGFKQYCINKFPYKRLEFLPIPYRTRGAAESACVALKQLADNDSVLLLDNDNIYKDLALAALPRNENFVLYTKNKSNYTHYSFVSLVQGDVLSIEERRPISDDICIGGYGFSDTSTAIEYCQRVVRGTDEGEPYMSAVVSSLLSDRHRVRGVCLPDAFSMGTPSDIVANMQRIDIIPARFVFDMDNTIVSHPDGRDYRSVAPVPHIVSLIRHLKRCGHHVTIHTARGMVSQRGSMDAIAENVAPIVTETLRRLDVPYDEIMYGKPYGDVYIDDKAYNAHEFSLTSQCGVFDHDGRRVGSSNKNNKIVRVDKGHVRKSGSALEGEVHFYQTIANTEVAHWFPRLLQVEKSGPDHRFVLEYIDGTTIDKIYAEGLMTESLMTRLLERVQSLHVCEFDDGVRVTSEDVRRHYLEKFHRRASRRGDYPFEDFEQVYAVAESQLHDFLSKDYPINRVIHGDLWFSNVLLHKQQFRFIDMRGKIADVLTVSGHTMYDIGKLYQSVIGLDCIIKCGEHVSTDVCSQFEPIFWNFWRNAGLTEDDIVTAKKLTGYLIFCTFFSYDDNFPIERKQKIWELVKKCQAATTQPAT